MTTTVRCGWAEGAADYREYHDREWGRPVRNDIALFERLSLEGFQAGLSWLTILRKREAFRAAFAGFDPLQVARFTAVDVSRLLADAGIVRHRDKIEGTIANAKSLLAQWEVAGPGWLTEQLNNHRPTEASLVAQGFVRPPERLEQLPAQSRESVALAKHLRQLGFRRLGPTTLYAAMQATGFVQDHLEGCFLFDSGPSRPRAGVSAR